MQSTEEVDVEEADGLKCKKRCNENEMEQLGVRTERTIRRHKDKKKRCTQADGERGTRRTQAPVAVRWRELCLQQSHQKPLSHMCVKFSLTCVSVLPC